ncbi:MAG: Maf family protein [Eubacteriales bacterium]
MKRIVLASQSPRRIELLSRLVEPFDVDESWADEQSDETNPEKLAALLAERKAMDVFERNRDAVVIGADTVVAVGKRILGKPEDEAHAREMILLLAGGEHFVYTGVCVVSKDFSKTVCCRTTVCFDKLSPSETDAYIATGDWSDKAGAYGIQGEAAKYIKEIKGDYYSVMGLPLHALYKLLEEIRILYEYTL